MSKDSADLDQFFSELESKITKEEETTTTLESNKCQNVAFLVGKKSDYFIIFVFHSFFVFIHVCLFFSHQFDSIQF